MQQFPFSIPLPPLSGAPAPLESLVSGEEGYQALEIVDAIYRSCRSGERITPGS